ncbi:hypothetical protein [Pseudoxanthomonas mexicana]
MNESQKKQCHAIIHGHAVAAAAGNAVPVPGLGIATDIVAMTTMTMSLCAVFGGNIKQEAAKTLAIAAIKNTMLKQPLKVIAKELSKLIPGLGQVVAPSITVVMLEAAGWVLAKELEEAQSEKASKRAAPGSVADIIEKNVVAAPDKAPAKKRSSKKPSTTKSATSSATAKKTLKKSSTKKVGKSSSVVKKAESLVKKRGAKVAKKTSKKVRKEP